MASAKRKTSTKRAAATRTVRKSQTKAASSSASVAKSATRNGAHWAERGAQQWQQGANEWAKQSAKLYQFPFANNQDAGDVSRQAAEQVKSATESFVRAGSDIMSQMFGGTDPMAQWKGLFDQAAGKMPKMGSMPNTEKLQDVARESAAQATRMASDATRALTEASELARENAEAMVECNNVSIAVSKEIGAEMINYANRTFSQNVELGKQLFACRTLNDMFDLSSKFMKTNLDGFFSETVRLSEKLFQLGNDVAEPLNERFSETSDRMSKVISA